MDWSTIKFVVFDVDGTLYRQRPVRARMAAELMAHAVRSRSVRTARILRLYRRRREDFTATGVDFERVLMDEVAAELAVEPAIVSAAVEEWMHRRPLPYLLGARYPGVQELFRRIGDSGRKIGVLSDFRAEPKLAALRLVSDHVVCAEDVAALKPSPLGLGRLMELAQETPATTLLIGDRADRDGEAARAAGVEALLRSDRPIDGYTTFRSYADPLFDF